MKKISKILAPVALLALAVPVLSACHFDLKEEVRPDDVEYDDIAIKDGNTPDFVHKAPRVSRAMKSATSFVLHFHHDDGKCSDREVWVWCEGVVGAGYTPQQVSADGKDFTLTINFTGEDAKFLNNRSISFIIKKKGTWLGQSDNMLVKYEEFEPDGNGVTTVWAVPGEGNAIEMYHTEAETKMDRFVGAKLEKDWKTITITATAKPMSYRIYALTANYMSYSTMATPEDLERYLVASGTNPDTTTVNYNDAPCQQFKVKLNYFAKVNIQYYLEGVFPEYQNYKKTKYVASDEIYETSRFKKYYEPCGREGTRANVDLGALYKDNTETTFRVWAPTATRVRLLVYESGTPAAYDDNGNVVPNKDGITGSDNYGGYNMAYRPGGIWELTLKNRDCNGMYYNYMVENSSGANITTDPYAKAVGVNGERGMVCDFSKTNPEGWSSVPQKWDGVTGYDISHPNDLSIYETHIRDLTMDESWKGKKLPGTYSAFVEKGTKVTVDGVTATSGFDHLEEMGLKAIHLLPVFDSDNLEGLQDRSFNWGYNPLNYNCVDGSYATDPYNGAARITEFKELVQAFAKNANKTRIIMDVVYNHVSSAPASCFNKLMPKYYFRYEPKTQTYYDGSGCGNEVKTEAPMMSKYIVDSLCWWAQEYKIKGFRFDLMGCIDWMTIKDAAKALYKIDPDIYLYGEGWTSGGCNMDYDRYPGDWGSDTWTVYNKLNKESGMCYVGAFNDGGRNAMRGENNAGSWGFIGQGSDNGAKVEAVRDMMLGYHTKYNGGDDTATMLENGNDPNQTVNYVSCHDNFTLYDQLMTTIGSVNNYSVEKVVRASMAAEAAVMFSNGVALMHGGEEVFRTKVVTAEDYASGLAKEGDTVIINGVRVSHNSYNLSDKTNAYKWDRKIKVGSVSTLPFVQELAKAIKARNNMKHYTKAELSTNSPYSSSSPFNTWYGNKGSTVIALKNGDYYFFINSVNGNPIDFDGIGTYKNVVFRSNPNAGGYSAGSGNISLSDYSCVCLTK